MNEVNEKNLVLTRAQSAVLSRDFVTATRLYKQLLKTDPSNVEYLKELGAIYVKNGEDAKAIPYYEQIITFYPHYVEAMNSLGAIYRRLKRYEDSIEILQRALDEDRQTGSVNYNLGFTYKEMGNYEDAIEAFEIVISENPSDVLAYNHLGRIYHERKEYQKSINSYKRGLGVDKNHPILNYNLALCYDEAKMYPEAIRCFETALKSKPGWLDAIKDFSSLLIRCQQTKEAADIVKRSIELHPNDAKLLCLLGRIYLADFDYDSATKTFKRAKGVDSNDVAVLSGLAEALEKSEKPLEALEPISQAIELSPDDLKLKKQYIYTLLSANEYDAALFNINELNEETAGKDLEVLDLYEQYYICTGDEAKAKEYSDIIVKANKHYKNHILSVAKRYSQIGSNEKAEKKAKEFIAREIRNPEGYNLLGKIYEDSGNVENAIENYNKSISMKTPNIHAVKQLSRLQNLIDNPIVEEEIVEAEPVKPLEEAPVITEEAIPETEEEKTEEDFDFEQMGGDIPMAEALIEDESPFFDDLEKIEEESLDSAEKEDIFDQFDDYSEDKNGPVNKKPSEGDSLAPSQESANPYAENPYGETPYPAQEMPQNPASALDNNQAQSNYYNPGLDAQMQRNIQDAVMKSSGYAMEAALNAQRMANEIAVEQANLKDKIKSLEEKAEQKAAASLPIEQAVLAEEAVSEASLPKESDNENPETEVFVTEELDDENPDTEAFVSEELDNENPPAASDLEEDDSEYFATVDSIFDELGLESASSEATDAAVTDADTTTDAAVTEAFNTEDSDSIYQNEDDFFYSGEALSEDEANALLGSPEDLYDDSTENEIEASSAKDLLPAIEKIISDEDIASENVEKVDLFKKLLSLSEYLPEEERKAFLSGKARMQMEYLVAKLSGKPGLLKTAKSLIKSGFLGEELVSESAEKEEAGNALSNNSVAAVIKTMEMLTSNLQDNYLAKALCIFADNVLEQIEIQETKAQIF